MILLLLALIKSNLIQLTDDCTFSCKTEPKDNCARQCVTLNNMMANSNFPSTPLLTTPEQEALRKTYDIAIDNQNLIDNNGNYNSDNMRISGSLYPNGTFDPKGNMPSGASSNNSNNPTNPFGPSNNNPVYPNNGSPTSPIPSSNNSNISTPGSNGLPLIPSVRPFNEATTGQPGISPFIPKQPIQQLQQPNIVYSTIPMAQVPITYVPVTPPKPLTATVTLKQTVLSYIPQLVTTTTTVQAVVVQQQTSTKTLPVYLQAPPQTVIQTLPRETIVQTISSPPVTSTLPAQTLIQPIELPEKTVTSIEPASTISMAPQTVVLTEIIRYPQITSTVMAPPVTVSLPATTVYVVSTLTQPQKTFVYEKQKPVYVPYITTQYVQQIVTVSPKPALTQVPVKYVTVTQNIPSVPISNKVPVIATPINNINQPNNFNNNLNNYLNNPNNYLNTPSNNFTNNIPGNFNNYLNNTPNNNFTNNYLNNIPSNNFTNNNLNNFTNNGLNTPNSNVPSTNTSNINSSVGNIIPFDPSAPSSNNPLVLNRNGQPLQYSNKMSPNCLNKTECSGNQYSKCDKSAMNLCYNDMLNQSYTPPAADESCSLKNITNCTPEPEILEKKNSEENNSSSLVDKNSSLKPSSKIGGFLNKVSNLITGSNKKSDLVDNKSFSDDNSLVENKSLSEDDNNSNNKLSEDNKEENTSIDKAYNENSKSDDEVKVVYLSDVLNQ